jgi:hypothetical protein
MQAKKTAKHIEPANKLIILPLTEIPEDIAPHLSTIQAVDSKSRVLAKSAAARKKREEVKKIISSKAVKITKEAKEMELARLEIIREKNNSKKRLADLKKVTDQELKSE